MEFKEKPDLQKVEKMKSIKEKATSLNIEMKMESVMELRRFFNIHDNNFIKSAEILIIDLNSILEPIGLSDYKLKIFDNEHLLFQDGYCDMIIENLIIDPVYKKLKDEDRILTMKFMKDIIKVNMMLKSIYKKPLLTSSQIEAREEENLEIPDTVKLTKSYANKIRSPENESKSI